MTTFCNNTNYLANNCVTSINTIISAGTAIIKVDKSADKYHAHVGDIVTINLIIRNLGDTWATNVRVVETIAPGISFVNSTFNINGTTYSALNPYIQDGAKVGNIGSGEFISVSYKIKITELLDPSEFTSSSTVKFNYTNNIAMPDGISQSVKSNTITIKIKYFNVIVTSTSDKYYARVGDEITYSTVIVNSGNIDVNNIRFMNTIPQDVSIIKDSYMLNGNILYGVNSAPKYGGIIIGTLEPHKQFNIVFKVRVDRIPEGDVLSNKSVVNCEYTIDPSIGSEPIKSISGNEVKININEAIIDYCYNYGVIQTVDKEFADINDIITYTVQLRNTGSTRANEITLTDSIPEGTKLVPNSVILNGRIEGGVSPQEGMGVRVGSIDPGGIATVSYKVQVVTLPNETPIKAMAKIEYKFTVHPNQPNKAKRIGYSEVVKTCIRNGNLITRMTADKEHANIGDIITYTLSITNSGNVSVDNLRILNNIPESTNFFPESITLNCKHLMFGNIERGIVIPNLTPNKTVILNFKVIVKSILKTGKIKNFSRIIYQYYKDDDYNLCEKEVSSNSVYTNVHSVDFQGNNFQQKSNLSFATVGDKVTYTFNIKNAGNIRATELMFYDTIPSELEFIKDSLTINGDISYGGNPEKGVVLGNLGSNDNFDIVFSAKVKSIPYKVGIVNKGILTYKYNMNPNRPLICKITESNETLINIKVPKITLYKTVNPTGTSIGKIVTFMVVAKNTGNSDAEEVIVRDTLNSVLEFKEGSLTVSGRYSNENIINGVNIGKLRPGQSKEITFKAEIVAFPEERILETTALSRYRFVVNPEEVLRSETSESNKCKLIIERVNVILNKKSSSDDVSIGSVITYNVEIENKSSIRVTDFIFRDELPAHLEFDSNSFAINGVVLRSVNIRSGVIIRYIEPKGKVHISYKVTVKSIPSNCKIVNTAYGEYNYKVLRDSPIETARTNMVKTEVRVPLPSFKQITIDSAFKLPPDKPDIVEVENVRVNVEVSNSYVSKTPSMVCDEDNVMKGYKLIVNGFIKCDVEYTAEGEGFGVYSASFRKPFTTYIMLASILEKTRDIDVRAFAEDVSYNVVSDREIRVNTIFMIDGKTI